MPIKLRSIVIATSQLKNILMFYELLGLKFASKKVSLGTEFYWTIADDLEIAFVEKLNIPKQEQPQYSFCFRAPNVDDLYRKINDAGFFGVLDPIDTPEGRRAIIIDPDGRSVELMETKN